MFPDIHRPTRVAVIGTGMIAAVHARSARATGAEVLGVLGRTPERSREAAAAMGVPKGFESLDELLAARPDVVHVCTPNDQHHAQAMAVVKAGVHVVCEKPLASTAGQADELAQAARGAGVVATVPFVYRYHPMVREIRARVRAGELGRVLSVHGHYLQDWMLDADTSSWRVDAAVGGTSRAFADIGSHWCDLVEFATGERLEEVLAVTDIVHPTRPAASRATFSAAEPTTEPQDRVAVSTEDTAAVTFRLGSGRVGNVVVSQVSAGRKNRLWFQIDGTAGSAAFDQENPESAWFGTEGGSRTVVRDPSRGAADQRRLGIVPAGHPQGYTDAFTAFVADTYVAVRGGTSEGLPTFDDGARAARIIDAVVHSAATNRWQAIG